MEHALSLSPSVAEAWNNKSVALANTGRIQEALQCVERALNLNPRYAEAWYNKGGILGTLGRIEDAIDCCDRAISCKPNYAAPHYNKGVALYQFREARQALQQAAQLGDPQASEALETMKKEGL